MEKQKVFIKRYPSKGELPSKNGYYLTQVGIVHFRGWFNNWIEYWLEEIELPSEDYLQDIAIKTTPFRTSFMSGANFILNHLKSNTNETDMLSK